MKSLIVLLLALLVGTAPLSHAHAFHSFSIRKSHGFNITHLRTMRGEPDRVTNVSIAPEDEDAFWEYLDMYCASLRFDFYEWRSRRCKEGVAGVRNWLRERSQILIDDNGPLGRALMNLIVKQGDLLSCAKELAGY